VYGRLSAGQCLKQCALQSPLSARLAECLCAIGAAMCDIVLIVAPLAEGLAVAAELEQVLKQDLNLKHDVLKINFFFPGEQINDDDYACSFSQAALPEGQSSARMSI